MVSEERQAGGLLQVKDGYHYRWRYMHKYGGNLDSIVGGRQVKRGRQRNLFRQ